MKNNSDIGDQVVDIGDNRFSYLLAVAASVTADGSAFVKKGVISSHSAVKSPVAIVAISTAVSCGLVVRVSSV
ncbi:hypothetical protein, partial [Klebsiella aerogenes]|uniref:hypothetical protein n=1 Tax=Klebsiella aerogenes TaxID=548 RepID=UPI001BCF893D